MFVFMFMHTNEGLRNLYAHLILLLRIFNFGAAEEQVPQYMVPSINPYNFPQRFHQPFGQPFAQAFSHQRPVQQNFGQPFVTNGIEQFVSAHKESPLDRSMMKINELPFTKSLVPNLGMGDPELRGSSVQGRHAPMQVFHPWPLRVLQPDNLGRHEAMVKKDIDLSDIGTVSEPKGDGDMEQLDGDYDEDDLNVGNLSGEKSELAAADLGNQNVDSLLNADEDLDDSILPFILGKREKSKNATENKLFSNNILNEIDDGVTLTASDLSDGTAATQTKKIIYPGCNGFVEQLRLKHKKMIMSDGYKEGSYGSNAACAWQILSPKGTRVTMRFKTFSLEQSDGCNDDYLTIYDGPNNNSPILSYFCGNKMPDKQVTSKNWAYIEFVSDDVSNFRGFEAVVGFQQNSRGDEIADPAICGNPKIKPFRNSRIIGGLPARPHSYPWIVGMFGKKGTCGTAIIHRQWVLTAAHCYKLVRHSKFYYGRTNLYKKNEPHAAKRRAIKAIVHPDYDPKTKQNDVMLIKMDMPVTWNDHVIPICLPDEDPPVGGNCRVAGWGLTRKTGDRKILQHVRLHVRSDCSGPKEWLSLYDPRSMLCAGVLDSSVTQGACNGDSGGPFVCLDSRKRRYILTGNVSFGPKGCLKSRGFLRPSVFSRTKTFIPWIKRTIKSNS